MEIILYVSEPPSSSSSSSQPFSGEKYILCMAVYVVIISAALGSRVVCRGLSYVLLTCEFVRV